MRQSESKITQYDMCSVQVSLEILKRDMPCARSLHKEVELAHVRAGELTVMIDDECVTVHERETLFISSFAIHEFIPLDGDVVVVRPKLNSEWLEAPFWGKEERARLHAALSHPFVIGRDDRVTRLFDVLAREVKSQLGTYRCLSGMMELSALVMSEPALIVQRCHGGVNAMGGMTDTLEYLHQHSNEELTLGDLARRMGMSESYCSKYFHQMLGVTFTDFLNNLRISDARYLLANSDLPVITVSQRVGFNSIQTFNRVFRKNCGQTPSEYRAQAKDAAGMAAGQRQA